MRPREVHRAPNAKAPAQAASRNWDAISDSLN
jgi:hypothetical protein